MPRLGIGIVGSGFNARFHLQSFVGVRDADILGIWSPNKPRAEEAAALSRRLGVGEAKAFPSIAAMVADPGIDAIWLCGPNHARIENVEEITRAVTSGTCVSSLCRSREVSRARCSPRLITLHVSISCSSKPG